MLRELLLLAVALYVALGLYGWFLADRVMFQPHPSSYRDDARILKLTTKNGQRISALHLASPAARYTLLVSHGNAEDLGDDPLWLDSLRDAGFNVLAYDYEGYGTSEGRPSEGAFYADEEAAYDYLRDALHLAPEQIILLGRSVGTAPAVYLAARRPVAGLILQSGFTSAFRVLTRVSLLPFDRFPSYRDVGRVHCPVLIMHGTADGVIGIQQGKALYGMAKEPKRALWIEGAGHDDLHIVGGERYLAALRDFAASLTPARP